MERYSCIVSGEFSSIHMFLLKHAHTLQNYFHITSLQNAIQSAVLKQILSHLQNPTNCLTYSDSSRFYLIFQTVSQENDYYCEIGEDTDSLNKFFTSLYETTSENMWNCFQNELSLHITWKIASGTNKLQSPAYWKTFQSLQEIEKLKPHYKHPRFATLFHSQSLVDHEEPLFKRDLSSWIQSGTELQELQFSSNKPLWAFTTKLHLKPVSKEETAVSCIHRYQQEKRFFAFAEPSMRELLSSMGSSFQYCMNNSVLCMVHQESNSLKKVSTFLALMQKKWSAFFSDQFLTSTTSCLLCKPTSVPLKIIPYLYSELDKKTGLNQNGKKPESVFRIYEASFLLNHIPYLQTLVSDMFAMLQSESSQTSFNILYKLERSLKQYNPIQDSLEKRNVFLPKIWNLHYSFTRSLDRIHNSVAEASLKHLEKTIDSILLDNLFTKTGKVVNPRIIYIAVVLVKEIRKLQEEGYAIKL